MRTLFPVALFLAAALGLASSEDAAGQTKKKKADPANKYAPPAPTKPDDATMRVIAEKTKQLKAAVEAHQGQIDPRQRVRRRLRSISRRPRTS